MKHHLITFIILCITVLVGLSPLTHAGVTGPSTSSTGNVTLNFTGSYSGWDILRSKNSGSAIKIGEAHNGSKVFTDNGLSDGVYRYESKPYNIYCPGCSKHYAPVAEPIITVTVNLPVGNIARVWITGDSNDIAPLRTTIHVNWSQASNAEYYVVDYTSPAHTGWKALNNNVRGTQQSYTVAHNGQHQFRVRACKAGTCEIASVTSKVVYGGSKTAVSFIPAGRPAQVEYRYDTLGRLRKVFVQGAEKSNYVYDKAGNRTNVQEN